MDYALIVGVGRFKNNLKSLEFVENDINGFKNILRSTFQVPEQNIFTLVDDQATKEAIEDSVCNITQNCTQDNRVFIYFATHGKSVYEAPYLACFNSSNSDTNDINNWICTTKLIGDFTRFDFNVLAFLDCCQSTYMFSGRGILDDTPSDSSCMYPGKYVGVFAAAGTTENAYADVNNAHGCWTYFLLQALDGKAPEAFKVGTKKITQQSLQNYLYCNVIQKVMEEFNTTQTPYFWGSFSEDFIIIELPEPEGIMINTKDIYWGEIDADSEKDSAPSQNYILENFYDLTSVSSVFTEKNSIQIIAGNKGTGKTYLGEYLASQSSEIMYLNIGKITANAILEITSAQANFKGKYVAPWKYILLSILAVEFVKQQRPRYEEIEKVLRCIYGTRLTQLIQGKSLRVSVICNKKIKQKINLSPEYSGYADSAGVSTLQDIVSLFEDIFSDIYAESKLSFCIDGLDEQIRDILDDRLKDMLLDLLGATNELNQSISNIKFVLFFRQDILRMLDGESNLNKTQSARTHELTWLKKTNSYQDMPLYQFINKRISTSLKGKGLPGDAITLMDILPAKMQQQDTWEWILELTTYTPRDIVSFFLECQKAALPEQTTFTQQNLWDAAKTYSEYLWKEFCDILSGTILSNLKTDLLDLLDKIGNRHTVKKKGEISFAYSEFISTLNEIDAFNCIDPNNVLQLIYEAGIVGVNTKDGMEYWYFRENPIKFDKLTWTEYKFKIHKGLWKKTHIW